VGEMNIVTVGNHDDVLALFESELEVHTVQQDMIDTSQLGDDEVTDDDGFNEKIYLVAYPDIAEAVASGEWGSGREHYLQHGLAERRLSNPEYLSALPADDSATFPACSIDAAFVSQTGWCLIIGWINDAIAPLTAAAWVKHDRVIATTHYFARCRREDAEGAVGARAGKLLGFWTVFRTQEIFLRMEPAQLRLWVGSECKTFQVDIRRVDDLGLRETALEYLAASRYFSNSHIAATQQLQSGLGDSLINYNIGISRKIIEGAHVVRFGEKKVKLEASIVVCLFGKAEYLFLQAALFSRCPKVDRYEFIYVSNSPELAERLLKEAKMASRIYGIAITLVILPANAGFGAANNIAAMQARSDRILIVNPDVFPRDREWAVRHSAIIANLPADQTTIFGVPLYYDDGSLMHSGMYFDVDAAVSIGQEGVEEHQLIRVEHYAKGAPPQTPAFLQSRRVPAVTGAFISIDRAWFERLGGFSPEYVFGHYEDADLCLKSFERGQAVWVHYAPFWHLEGKGSVRRPAHEGGSTVNRWHFTETWGKFIADGLIGRSPTRLAPTASAGINGSGLHSAAGRKAQKPRSQAPSSREPGGQPALISVKKGTTDEVSSQMGART
jgi:GT2 family glycosyltransferase